jgi:hypothetical protein
VPVPHGLLRTRTLTWYVKVEIIAAWTNGLFAGRPRGRFGRLPVFLVDRFR